MVIFGVTLLAICMLLGLILGEFIGYLMGIDANIGGVGIAMVLLVLSVDYLSKRNKLSISTQRGIEFWSAMYIPIVVAMAASQNVVGAVEGGPLALLAGLAATVGGWALVPLLSKGKRTGNLIEAENEVLSGGNEGVKDAK